LFKSERASVGLNYINPTFIDTQHCSESAFLHYDCILWKTLWTCHKNVYLLYLEIFYVQQHGIISDTIWCLWAQMFHKVSSKW